MPSISGPSITSSGRASACRASSVSSSMKSTMPWTSACESRSSTGASRQDEVDLALVASPVTVPANVDQPVGRVRPPVEEHVLDALEQVRLGMSS